MDRKPSRKKVVNLLLGKDFSKMDETHPLMRFIDDPVTLDELNDKPVQYGIKSIIKGSYIYWHVLILNLLNFVEEVNPDSSEIKTIQRKIVKCKDDHQEFYRTLEELRIAMAFKSKLWSCEFEPRVGDGDFDLVVHSGGKRVYVEVYFPDGDTSDVRNLRVKIDEKLSDFDETDGDAIFLVNVGALPEKEGYIENATKFVDETPKLSGILFYKYNLNLMISQQPTNEIIMCNHWFKSPMKNIFKEVLDTVSGFEYKFYDYPKYDFSHNRISSTEK